MLCRHHRVEEEEHDDDDDLAKDGDDRGDHAHYDSFGALISGVS